MRAIGIKALHAAPWGYPLLVDIELELVAGEIMGIIGPNGAGKTSLLGTLTGDTPISAGQIELLEQPLASWSIQERAKSIAVMPQQALLSFPFSVEEVVLLGRTPHSTGVHQDRQIAQQVMQATDTLRLRDRIYTQLSGGEKQRVQLARVFAQVWHGGDVGGRLLILDEPTTALDLAHQQLIVDTLKTLAATGCAIVVVAHDFNLVAAIAQQICVLHRGRQVVQGSPEQVLTPELFKTVFEVDVSVVAHPVLGQPRVFNL